MRLLVELSAEHDQLPLAELRAVLEISGGALVATDRPLAIVDADPAFLAKRLGLAHSVSEHWWSGPVESLTQAARPVEGSVAVRARRVEGARPEVSASGLERALGAAIGGPVDLAAPENDVRLFITQKEAHVGRLLCEIDRRAIDARHVKHRAHFAPVSLHPRFARALVNLARVREGDRVADPFCGTGGLALEGALVGARVLASDLDPRMVVGTRESLAEFGVRDAIVETRDVGELPEFAPDLAAIVTDPPYGRSSTTNQEEIGALYDRFYAAAREALRPGGRIAMITADPALLDGAARAGFRRMEAFEQRVHKSMTRHYGVFLR